MSSVDCASGSCGSRGEGGMLVDESAAMEGNGGRKAGIWEGDFQCSVRARLRDGEEGLDMGERGSGGVDGRGGGVFLSSGDGERIISLSTIIATSSSSPSMSTSSSSSSLTTGGLS